MKSTKLHVIRLAAEDVARIVEILTLYKTGMPSCLEMSRYQLDALITRILNQASKGPRK